MFCIKRTGIACLHLEPQSLQRLRSDRVAIWILEAIKHMLQSMLLFACLHPEPFCLNDQLISWTSHIPIVLVNQDLQCLGSFLEWWDPLQKACLELIWDLLEVLQLCLLMEDVSLNMGWMGDYSRHTHICIYIYIYIWYAILLTMGQGWVRKHIQGYSFSKDIWDFIFWSSTISQSFSISHPKHTRI